MTITNTPVTQTGPVKGAASGRCVDVPGNSQANSTRVALWDRNNTTAQKWTLNADGSIAGVGSGKCLDASSRGTANGTLIQLWTCNGATNQKWSRS